MASPETEYQNITFQRFSIPFVGFLHLSQETSFSLSLQVAGSRAGISTQLSRVDAVSHCTAERPLLPTRLHSCMAASPEVPSATRTEPVQVPGTIIIY